MRIIEPSVEILTPLDAETVYKHLEQCGRVCYKSEDKTAPGSAEKFLKRIVMSGHESVLEHFSVTFKVICDRSVSHQIVRHRIASYSQESQRYCNYTKDGFQNEITVVRPAFASPGSGKYNAWYASCDTAEQAYFYLINEGCTPQEARAVLPNCTKTEIVCTMNIRELRHFLKLRTSKAADPAIRMVAKMLLSKTKMLIPVLFDDIEVEA